MVSHFFSRNITSSGFGNATRNEAKKVFFSQAAARESSTGAAFDKDVAGVLRYRIIKSSGHQRGSAFMYASVGSQV